MRVWGSDIFGKEWEDFWILLPGVPARTDRGFLGFCSVCLFRLQGELCLFDTGSYADRSLLLQQLGELRIDPIDIKYLMLSHLHYDHCLNLSLFPRAAVFLSRKDFVYARRVLAGEVVDSAVADNAVELLDRRDCTFVDEEMDLFGEVSLKVFPGHTPGGLVAVLRRNVRVALCGDVVKNACELVNRKPSMVTTDYDVAVRSMEKLLEVADHFIPGHDSPFSCRDGEIVLLSEMSIKISADLDLSKRTPLSMELRRGINYGIAFSFSL
ncbi:MBL fold metallo-hydrolase [Thermodesulforhabdus norvegica]|uniref:Glyoxylase, beta-lactamase superfamily II n=1 Tax=Thermodesulforhabdus norvegica TaxID=39841 RepID=A0A1I4R388_9BACT|nr:MBL fold metallo-hydrolase [Thermodesulforhabdus norvegica]SFM46768.1 Glyoxylase, beta-lactamase superfamily II [Thermodesulforhabdus norvegica]